MNVKAIALTLCSLQAITYSFAQAQENLVLEEVIVTAQKRAQSLQDVGLTVNAFSAEALDKTATFDFSDIAKLTGGLDIVGDNGVETEISLRGVGKAATAQGDAPVAVFFDSVVQPVPGAVFGTMLDVQRVEVLRGPQGTLYGKNAPTGVINIVSNNPNFDGFEADIEGTISSWKTQEYRGAVNIPLVDNVLALRIAGLYNESDGFIDNITLNTDAADKKRSAGRAKLLFTPTEDLSITLTALYSEFESGNTFSLLEPFAFDHEAVDNFAGEAKDQNEAAHLHVEWDIAGHTLTSISGYQEYTRFQSQDIDGTASDATFLGFDNAQRLPGNSRTVSQELRLASNNESDFEYTVGLFYQLDVGSANAEIFADGTTNVTVDNTTRTESYGVFSHNIWHINEQWQTVFGLRYSDDSKGLDEVTTLVSQGRELAPVDLKDNYYNLSGTLKLQYFTDAGNMAYVSLDSAFRSGGFNPFLTLDLRDKFTRFDTETSNAAEVGIKTQWWDDRLQFNVAVYYQEYEDFQVLRNANSDVIGCFFTIDDGATCLFPQAVQVTGSADEAVSTGAEVEINALLTENWSIGSSLAYNDTEIKQWDDAPCKIPGSQDPDDVPGIDFDDSPGFIFATTPPLCSAEGRSGNVPHWSGSVTSEYRGSFADGSLDWFARGLVAFKSERNDPMLGGYGTVDLFLGLESADQVWSVTLWGKNVTDKEYLLNVTGSVDVDNDLDGTADGSLNRVVVGAPQSFGITGKYSF